MGKLLTKSAENLCASDELIKLSYFNSSVHCSYYSVVQFMIHLILNRFNYSQERFDEESRYERLGSHVFAQKLLYRELQSMNFILASRDFKKEFGVLKNIRNQADYQEIIIEPDVGKQAREKAKSINDLLSKHFNDHE
jgi:hypothetical protein